jgi:CheY-like chemotaxis protein
MPNSEPSILVVEDNPLDVHLIKLALKDGGFQRDPVVLDDGMPALALLRGERQYEHLPFPDLVILDLNLKCLDGPEVLSYIRRSPQLSDLFVAILSSSPTDVMIHRAAEANCYFSKPADLDTYIGLGRQLRQRFLQATSDKPPASMQVTPQNGSPQTVSMDT